MAEHADGSIIVDTEIDSEGFKADSQKLHKAMTSLGNKMKSLGPIFQKALSGNSNAISNFDSKASGLQNTIQEIQREIQRLGNTQIPTDEYAELCREAEKAEQALFKLYERKDKMEAVDTSKDSKAWKALQYDIKNAEAELSRYERGKQAMEAKGTAFQSGADTTEYAQLNSQLSTAKANLVNMQAELLKTKGGLVGLIATMRAAPPLTEQIRSALSRVANVGSRIINVFKSVGGTIKISVTHPIQSANKAIGAITSGLKYIGKKGVQVFGKLGTKLNLFSKQSKRASFSMNSLSGRMRMMAMMIKQMLVMRVFMGILTAIGDGFKNLSQYSRQTNADLSTLKSALTQLKNSFATAFAPILTVVTPILATLINYLAAAITFVGKFVAALTGAKSFTKATAVQENFAASIGATGAAAEKAEKQLAGFDELNVLSDSSSGGGGGGGGAAAPSEMFEEVPIDSEILNFVDNLKEMFKNGDWAGIGELVGNGINLAVQKVNDFIRWETVGEKITTGMKNAATCFNALVDTVDWNLIGDTLAQGLNTALNILYLTITEFDWPGLAAGLAEGLNGLVSGFDWGLLGTTLSTGAITLLATLRSAITTFDWASLGKGVADGINNIDWVGLLSNAAGLLSDAVIGLLDLVIGFAENLDWGKLGRDCWNGIVGILTNIDWNSIISKAFRLLGNAVGGAATLIWEFCVTAWESIKSGFESLKSTYFEPYFNEMGEMTIEGFFKGIGDMLADIGNWIVENIWNPFIEGFKNAFGIHSPSTKMAEMGGFIVEGLLNGIKNAWNTITGFFSGAFEGIKTTISNAWESIKKGASTAWDNITSTLSSAWDGIKSTASETWENLKTTVSNGWEDIKSAASEKWTEISTNLSSTWEGIKSTASETWENLKTTISNGWENIKSSASTKWSEISSNLSTTWGNIKTSASETWENLKTNISNGWENIKTTTSEKWSNIKSDLSSTWDNIKSTASTKWDNLKSTISTGWNNIKSEASSGWEGIKSTLSSKWDDIKSTASSKWDNIKTTIKEKGWSGVGEDICNGISSGIDKGWSWLKTKVSNVATSLLDKAKSALGIHSPSRLFRDIVGLNIGYGIGDGIEASEGSVLNSVTGLAEAIAAEANAGEYNIGGIVSTSEVDGALTDFSDKVANSFSALLERLQAIADGVTFTTPLMATGKIVPYSVTAKTDGPESLTGAIEASNDELGSVIIQAVTNATTAIVTAIEEHSGTVVNLDADSIATNTIKEINRRTRAMGKSPLIASR